MNIRFASTTPVPTVFVFVRPAQEVPRFSFASLACALAPRLELR